MRFVRFRSSATHHCGSAVAHHLCRSYRQFVSCRHSRRLILSADRTCLSCTRRGRRHSTAAFPLFYHARAARRAAAQFLISSTKRFSVAVASTSSQHRSYRCTARPSSDPLGLRGTILLHSADGRPFSLQPPLPHDALCISHATTALRWSHQTAAFGGDR